MASSFLDHLEDWVVSIPATTEIKNVFFYVMHIRIGRVRWTVNHRYSDFSELHKFLVLNHGVSKDVLPGKTLFYVRNESFIDSRRIGLQKYINDVIKFLSNTMPPVLVSFLELDKYDFWFLLKDLSNRIKTNRWLENPPGTYEISIIEANAISERLKLPSPPPGILNSQTELSIVLEFCGFLKTVHFKGEKSDNYGTSNINFYKLPFEISIFKSLDCLVLSDVCIRNLIKAKEARNQVKHLVVNNCKIEKLAEILLCDHLHLDWKKTNVLQIWHILEKLDVQYNNITDIDSGLELIKSTREINANYNKIESIKNIEKLTNLNYLSVSNNKVASLCDLNLPLLTYLNISNNRLKNIVGIEQLISLETLFLSFNVIEDFDDLNALSKLMKLTSVELTGNPIAQKTDYRTKVIIKFGARASVVCLDNKVTSNHELELVAVIQAINFVQEGKLPSYNKNLTLDNKILS